MNRRLTFHRTDGSFGVDGVDLVNLESKLYMCIVKLKDYEDIGLNPDEVQRLIYENEDLKAELAKLKGSENDG